MGIKEIKTCEITCDRCNQPINIDLSAVKSFLDKRNIINKITGNDEFQGIDVSSHWSVNFAFQMSYAVSENDSLICDECKIKILEKCLAELHKRVPKNLIKPDKSVKTPKFKPIKEK